MSFFTLTVADIVKETKDASSIYFSVPLGIDKAFKYTSGQFVSLELKIKGQKIVRSYSLSSNPEELNLRITVKRVPGGIVSNYLLDELKIGDKLEVSKPLGQFLAQKKAINDHHLFFAAGSGIGPIASMVQELLNKTKTNITLHYCSRCEDSIILENELNELADKYKERFSLIHNLSQAQGSGNFTQGRLTPENSLEFLKDFEAQNTQVYVCGPDGYMDRILVSLKDLKFNPLKIHKESFTVLADKESDGVFIGDLSQKGTPSTMTVKLNGQEVEIKVEPDKSITDLLLDQNLDPPYSCMGGHCMACIAKVESGLVVQEDEGILTEENIEDSESLTCQAKPASPHVKIIFEDVL